MRCVLHAANNPSVTKRNCPVRHATSPRGFTSSARAVKPRQHPFTDRRPDIGLLHIAAIKQRARAKAGFVAMQQAELRSWLTTDSRPPEDLALGERSFFQL
jgi:hypothetical protein